MASQQVQGSRAVVVWIDSETAEEFVPLSVAEKLAAAIEGHKKAIREWAAGGPLNETDTALWAAVAEYRLLRPAGEHRKEGQP